MNAPTPAAATRPNAHRPGFALAGLALTMLLSSLATSSANVALPTLSRSFAASFQTVQWVVLSYLLVVTTSVVAFGRLGDLVGRRRLLLLGLVAFTVGSVASGLAPTLALLVAARAAQGLGAAVMMALTLALVSDLVPKERTGSAMGLLGTTSAIGTALGPSVGGALIGFSGWRALFLVNAPLAAVALLLLYRYLPSGARPGPRRAVVFDVKGTLLLAMTLTAYALATTLGGGHFGGVNAALFVFAVAGLVLFLAVERRAPAPLVRTSLLTDRVIGASLGANLFVTTVLMSTLVVGPFYLSIGYGLAPALVGLVMAAGPIVAAITGVPAGRVVDRAGTRKTTLFGLAGVATGGFLLALLPASLGVVGYVAPSVIMTAGYALFQAANGARILESAKPEERGVVSGTLNLSRNLGLVSGACVMGALFTTATGGAVALAHSAAVASAAKLTFAVATGLALVALVWIAHATASTSLGAAATEPSPSR
ncbi:MAG: MFS transporter [Polyangiaceae bacterium]